MDKIELTRDQLISLMQAATGNVKDFVMNNDGFVDEWMKKNLDCENQHCENGVVAEVYGEKIPCGICQ